MPPVSQFPPARVFLKGPYMPSTPRLTTLTSTSVPRGLTTTSSITSRSPSQTATPRSSGTAKCSASNGSGMPFTFLPLHMLLPH
ncbi:hypothetical protein M011DRAFT_471278 [Sporormia fimetaria CBS 119925]|uniref:Uncharacterized protein n=1 Tax=Sporormia fimetaria CBS 119925 TaxID=1340428 RepID=A0A6A6V0I4_9PLEO|nr:hypothetical protein M011DRAFT_471278 [Sporormia fimetaria CBS 119925]